MQLKFKKQTTIQILSKIFSFCTQPQEVYMLEILGKYWCQDCGLPFSFLIVVNV